MSHIDQNKERCCLTDTECAIAGNEKLAGNATDLLASHPTLLDSMRNAYMGNYQVVLSLLSSIENGKETKALVDTLIDSCGCRGVSMIHFGRLTLRALGDAVVNLREIIVDLRMRYSVSTADEKTRISLLDRATQAVSTFRSIRSRCFGAEHRICCSSNDTFSCWLSQTMWTKKTRERPERHSPTGS